MAAPDLTDELAKYVGDEDTSTEGFVAECATSAREMVIAYTGGAENPHRVPADVLKRAILEVGGELYHRRSAPGGIRQFATEFGGSPMRVARDPMVAAYPLLAPHLPGGFA